MSDSKRLDTYLERIAERLTSMDITLAKQSVLLDEHIKRTNLLEEQIRPIQKHVAMVNGALKALGVLALILGIVEAIARIKGG
jgi:hypothetical protein